MTSIRQFNNDEFFKGTFVVDPAGCGCTDCLMGYSTPEDELSDDQIMAAFTFDFEFIDRRGSMTLDNPVSRLLAFLRKSTT